MMQTTTVEPSISNKIPPSEHRHRHTALLALIEVDRASVVDSVRDGDEYELDSVYSTGAMRELCPACENDHLQLVLRQKRVRHAHLFCASCNKCFDASYPDGSPALELDY